MKAKDWREKSSGEQKNALLELRVKLRQLRFDLATREAKNHTDYGKIKKDIARLLTLEKEAAKVVSNNNSAKTHETDFYGK